MKKTSAQRPGNKIDRTTARFRILGRSLCATALLMLVVDLVAHFDDYVVMTPSHFWVRMLPLSLYAALGALFFTGLCCLTAARVRLRMQITRAMRGCCVKCGCDGANLPTDNICPECGHDP